MCNKDLISTDSYFKCADLTISQLIFRSDPLGSGIDFEETVLCPEAPSNRPPDGDPLDAGMCPPKSSTRGIWG